VDEARIALTDHGRKGSQPVAKQRLLVVDSDARSLRVLEVSLRKAGYNVTTAVDGIDALAKVETEPPDLIISDTNMPEMDGYSFAAEVKNHREWAEIPFIFLSRRTTIEDKVRGLELGVDDFLTKPIFVKEIVTRVKMLLQRKTRESMEHRTSSRTSFSGSLEDMTVIDLLQTVDFSRKSGVLNLAQDHEVGRIFFRDGSIIDAEAGTLQGAEAVYRILSWSQGTFSFEFRNVRRAERITESTAALLMEGMRRIDEWSKLLEGLPPLQTRFEVDYHELAEQLADIPDEVNQILRLFNGERSIMEVVEQSGMTDVGALNIICKLYFDGLVYDPGVEGGPVSSTAKPAEQPVGPEPPASAERPQDQLAESSLDSGDSDIIERSAPTEDARPDAGREGAEPVAETATARPEESRPDESVKAEAAAPAEPPGDEARAEPETPRAEPAPLVDSSEAAPRKEPAPPTAEPAPPTEPTGDTEETGNLPAEDSDVRTSKILSVAGGTASPQKQTEPDADTAAVSSNGAAQRISTLKFVTDEEPKKEPKHEGAAAAPRKSTLTGMPRVQKSPDTSAEKAAETRDGEAAGEAKGEKPATTAEEKVEKTPLEAAPAARKDERADAKDGKKKKDEKTAKKQRKEPSPHKAEDRDDSSVRRENAFFDKGEQTAEEYDSFRDLATVGAEPVSRAPMIVTIILIITAIGAGVAIYFVRANDRSREFDRGGITHHARSDADRAGGDAGDATPVSTDQDAGEVEAAPIPPDAGDTDGAVTGDAEAAVAPDAAMPEAGAVDAGAVETVEVGTSDAAETAAPTPEQVREARQLANRAALIADRSQDEALEMARRATELDPEQSTAWFVIAFVESERGNTDAAREAVERCLARPSAVAGDCRALQRSLAE
jgi:DNA-binding response OmpR family regulator